MANVTAHFKDGTTAKSLKGYKVEYNENTKYLYKTIMDICKNTSTDKTA